MVEPSRFTRSGRARIALGTIACSTTLSLAATLVTPVATAQPASMTELVTSISQAQSNIDDLNLNIGDLQEKVNQALVDLKDAQGRAEQARQGAEEAKKRLEASEHAVEEARAALDEVTRSQYRGAGQSGGLDMATSGDAQKDVLDRSLYLRQRSDERRAKLDEVERARTEAANEASIQRKASQLAESTASEAEAAEAEARELLDSTSEALAEQRRERDRAQSELDSAQASLAEQRQASGSAPQTHASESGSPTETAALATSQTAESEGAQQQSAQGQAAQPSIEASAAAPEQQVTADEIPEDVVLRVEQHAADIDPSVAQLSSETVAQALTNAAAANGESLQSEPEAGAAGAPDAPAPSFGGMSSDLNISEDTIAAAAGIIAAAAMVGATQANHTSLESPYGSSSDSEVIAAFAGGLSDALGAGGAAQVNQTSDEESASTGTTDNLNSVLPEVDSAATVSDTIQSAVSKASGSQSASSSGSIETVIARAQSAIGTPYVWGGGDANGPTTGVDGGSQAGFDCSGLVLYAFAAVGISLPHYTGYQYQRGTQVPASEAQRGDLLFWGPGGNQHVAIYLGDGTMIEAPQAGQNVQISPVRYSGMAPNAVRLL
ncbi:NlpC/P60 family protein [Corynebacterium hadale]|uniref:DIP1281 family NlpC/P60 protein n=1 Tax=Corynebacterium hadale TaxID=2026255 RepID=UPI001EF2964F|nr:NlpC/P60 family protein [Corynebacterium hadale]MCG7255478.1 NlpC/P60 family protein [Corynebacterium hadale]